MQNTPNVVPAIMKYLVVEAGKRFQSMEEPSFEYRRDLWQTEFGGTEWIVDSFTLIEGGEPLYLDIYIGEYDGMYLEFW